MSSEKAEIEAKPFAGSNGPKKTEKRGKVELIFQGDFVFDAHFYPKVLNATIHPMVSTFLQLGNERLIDRYCHLNPQTKKKSLAALINYRPRFFRWAGCDLFHVMNGEGRRQMIIVETNSCPSGQKSMPLLDETQPLGGYKRVADLTFKQMVEHLDKSIGGLAVVYDKNYMEASGYACALAESMKEMIYLVEMDERDKDPPVRWVDRYMEIRHNNEWHRIRAAFRYVTQKPWNRIPIQTETLILNPILVCLAGGRNKAVASKAYAEFNRLNAASGLEIKMPETRYDIRKAEIPHLVKSMGGHAVIKVPYSNAGQGVYTITKQSELDDFMAIQFTYDKFVVQSLVGNSQWSSETKHGKFFHTGTLPDMRSHTYACDIRMMVSATNEGYQPVALYARKAAKPLVTDLESCPHPSWDILGTNLSEKDEDGNWTTNPGRLLMMDRKDFNQLGIGIDDLIDGFIQSVFATIAIDQMCQQLVKEDGSFDHDLFGEINPDLGLLNEIVR